MIAKPTESMRVVSLNLNGLRSSVQKGVLDWLDDYDVDVICLQETRVDRSKWVDALKKDGWHCQLYPAEKAGYAGTAIYAKTPWQNVTEGLGFDRCDSEGRFIAADFDTPRGLVTIASAYFPSGSSSEDAQARKDEYLTAIMPLLKQWQTAGKQFILCGDVNIAHKEIDIKNWKGNLKNSGFLPHERAWLDELFAHGYVDVFRQINQQADEYSWWSNRGQARANNVGWRIDYQFATQNLSDSIVNAFIYRDNRFSDHAPVVVDYRF